MRFSECIVADVTTLNFNLMFEIGYALGLEVPVIPIRDTTIITSRLEFQSLGLLDTLGYLDFQNADTLARGIIERWPVPALPNPRVELNRDKPLLVVKGHIPTEGDVRLMSTLKRSALNVQTVDIVETPRLSLHEARRRVNASLGVVVHMLSLAGMGRPSIMPDAHCLRASRRRPVRRCCWFKKTLSSSRSTTEIWWPRTLLRIKYRGLSTPLYAK